MLTLAPAFGAHPRILFLGAHSDDIEIGCGATALRLLGEHPGAIVRWVVVGAAGERAREARESAAEILAGVADHEVRTLGMPDSFFPSHAAEIKRELEVLKGFAPDLVLTHCEHDLHQDHRLVSELTRTTFRDQLVLEYEIPKYDGDLRSPNVFVALERSLCERKAAILQKHFATQRARHWFDDELFLGLMRIRGAECRSPTGYAEGFYARKLLFAPSAARRPRALPADPLHADPLEVDPLRADPEAEAA